MEPAAVYVDMGTTNSRAWLATGPRVVARARVAVGAGETARSGRRDAVRGAFRDLVARVRQEGEDRGLGATHVVACGMITSSLGLAEVDHVPAPAGIDELARRLERHAFPEVPDLPVFLVPGVRCSPGPVRRETVDRADLIRGEESLCVGLAEEAGPDPDFTLLNLGSHWKAIHVDDRGRIDRSRTTLSGELIHAVRTETVLSTAVPKGRSVELDHGWLESGMRTTRKAGLPRALFCVRLLESGSSTPEDRLAFLYGAVMAADLETLLPRADGPATRVVISGEATLAGAFRRVLAEANRPAEILPSGAREASLLLGMRKIVARAGGVAG